MFSILVSDKSFVIAIILFLLCMVIGFFGDIYMRKNKKMGSLLDNERKNDSLSLKNTEEVKEQSNSAPLSGNVNNVQINNNMMPFENSNQNNDEQINNLF